MKLHGTKLILASAVALTTSMTQAENLESPQLTTFQANTPAKATEVNTNFTNLRKYSTDLNQVVTTQAALIEELEEKVAEVNANFTDLRKYSTDLNQVVTTQTALIEALEEKVAALENENSNAGDGFTIPVKGDGELIGYTNEVVATFYDPTIILKTDHGITSITRRSGNGKYQLKQYDNMFKDDVSFSVNYSDSNCQNPVSAINSRHESTALFTKTANILDSNLLFEDGNSVYTATKGTIFNTQATEIYRLDNNVCSKDSDFTAGATLPLTELTTLKSVYNTIEIEGYVSN